MHGILSVIVNVIIIVILSLSLEMLAQQAHYSTINMDKRKMN